MYLASIISLVTAVSSPVLTLEQCLERGLREGISLQRQESVLRENHREKVLALFDFLPQISLQAGGDFSWGRSVDVQELKIIDNKLNYSNTFSAAASYSTVDILNSLYNWRNSSAQRKSGLARMEDMTASLEKEIAEACLRLLIAEKTFENARTGYHSISVQRERTEKEVEAGKLSLRSLTEIEAQAASEEAAMTDASGEVRLAKMALSRYLNLSPEEEFTIAPPSDDSIPHPGGFPSAEEMAGYVASHPRIREAEANLQSGRIRKSAALAAMMPEIQITGGYGTYYSNTSRVAYRNQITGNVNPSLGVTLTIPITSGSSRAAQINKCSAELERLELDLENAREDIYCEMLTTLLGAINCYENCNAAEKNMNALEEAFRANEARFENGAISSSDYIVSRNNYQKAVGDYWQARYRYLFQLKIMDLHKIPRGKR